MNPPELYDLHVHSTRSDGLRSPLELARLANRHGLSGIAIADHDVLPDVDALCQIEGATGVTMIPAIELSTRWQSRRLHLLAYGMDTQNELLRAVCKNLLDARRIRWRILVERLGKIGLRLDASRLQAIEMSASPGRLHLARELVANRQATTIRKSFELFLEPIHDCEGEFGAPLGHAVDMIRQAGGVAVLAHPPFGLSQEDWKGLADLGLDGIEVRFGAIKRSHREFLEARVAEYGWIGTAGSDYHGDGNRNELGLHTVDREILEKLLAKRHLPGQ